MRVSWRRTPKKSGAGQYFTPRPLIDCMVAVTKPQPGEYIQDPAAGTCGFLVAVDSYIKQNTDDLYNLSEEEQQFQRQKAFYGTGWVRDAQRLALMDLMLHDIEGNLDYGDTLGPKGADLHKADLILTNPPFGSKKGGGPTRDDFTFPTSNKQLAFLLHIYRGLKPSGRAAVVLPEPDEIADEIIGHLKVAMKGPGNAPTHGDHKGGILGRRLPFDVMVHPEFQMMQGV